MEEWKEVIKGTKCTYFVSNQGRLKSITKTTEKILKGGIDGSGYRIHTICKKTYQLHQLVALCFIGSRPEGMVIDHINRIKLDNRVENLRYCTVSENGRNTHYFRTDIEAEDIKERRRICSNESHSKKYTCECGTILRKDSKSRHERRKKHQNYLKNL